MIDQFEVNVKVNRRNRQARKVKKVEELGKVVDRKEMDSPLGRLYEEKKEERKEEKKEVDKEPWSGEEPAKRMVANGFFTTTNVGGTFKQTDNFKTPMDSCPSFKNNMHKIRAPDCPIPEEKLVKLANGPESFICAAKITVPDFNRTMILTQVPDLSRSPDTADFWRMIHQESIVSVVIAVMPLEVTLQQILPLLSGTYSTYGKMFVNNKKVESAVGMTEYCLEILPDGCSNSLLTTVYHMHNWRQKRGLEVVTDLVTTMEKVMKVNENSVLMSMNGTGRAGIFQEKPIEFRNIHTHTQ
ncbi:Tyrosine-protein phosphatase domain-containing protein [Caenorhabditis elegans]|uniref:Tyrosine-protein phosphatase domain-containing protein n=1 Tax=Caenorhabditis elegans TaxID=6239 RepID=Q9U2S5_CAEEL|nr:Tyrosine-protein phosphatase domain-containing protein [Caenorhabditis elegans]CAB55152.1 Tyrosine-protein phosphatase domain-containing protein [Caenorhabditis elegans]|eukprot:NP_503038.1 Uncharacterized protein CELE_Y116A8C.37 [Caenorhabditis elegans]